MIGALSLRRSMLVAALIAVSAPAAWAGLFGHGSAPPDWGLVAAKTKTPDYAKDADSLLLYDEYLETVDESGRAVERERWAVRILKPRGRDHLCEVSYDVDEKINYFRAWTIAADEKQYQAQDTDFVDVGSQTEGVLLATRRVRIAHPPAVDVGAVEICESEEQLSPYFHEMLWHFQYSTPVVYEALEVDLPPGRAHTEAWFHHEPVKAEDLGQNHFRWELRDVPALDLREIPSRPAWVSLAGRMNVQWGSAAVEGREKQWQAIGQWFTELEAGRADPNDEISAKARELVAGAPDLYTRLSRIAEYIQTNVRYFVVERGIGGHQAHPAAEIFHNRYGDCKDKATIAIAMLKTAGIDASYLLVDTDRGYVDPAIPSVWGNHMITAIAMPDGPLDPRLRALTPGPGGRRYLIFDPTDERTPIGNLRGDLAGGWGLMAAGAQSQLLAIPVLAPEANGIERAGKFTLGSDGALSGELHTAHSGPEGSETRYFLKYTDEKERREYLEKELASDLPGVALEDWKFAQPGSFDQPVRFDLKVKVNGYAHTAGPLLLVRPRVLGSDARRIDQKPRTVPINFEDTGRWHDVYEIALPAGWTVDELPDPVDLDNDYLSYHAKTTAEGGLLRYERTYEVKKVVLPADRARDVIKTSSAILADEKGTAVLKKQ